MCNSVQGRFPARQVQRGRDSVGTEPVRFPGDVDVAILKFKHSCKEQQ